MSRGAPATTGVQAFVQRRMVAMTDVLAHNEQQLWALAVLAGVLDVWLTSWGLRVGLAEGNPVVAVLLAEVGIVALAGVKGGLVAVAVGCRQYRPRWGPWLSLGLVLPWMGAVAVNLALLVGA